MIYKAYTLVGQRFLFDENISDIHILGMRYSIDMETQADKLVFTKEKWQPRARTLCGCFERKKIDIDELDSVFIVQKYGQAIKRPIYSPYSVNFVQLADIERFRLYLARQQSDFNLCAGCVGSFYADNDLKNMPVPSA